MAEDTTQKGRGNDFGMPRRGGPGHPEASSKPIVNAELAPANEKRKTVMPHPGVRHPQA